MSVLDLGGTIEYWESAPVKPNDLTIVNLLPARDGQMQGDACDPPSAVLNRRFDLIVSNSVLEHVGGHYRRQQLAEVVRNNGDRHWVQTPYRYFPVEPHWLFPGLQFLPFAARVKVTQNWPMGHMQERDEYGAVELVHEVELVSRRQMSSYFPESTVWFERFAGLPKSLVAFKD
ncbi:class I SAM-dependent methyltransferase [Actinomycetospora corticicola]|uniref:Methyltransferase family protein n=1 Tax=Actinomycetospora corticicola TaxID=663602 RepID=A0A7Y9J405_9PSEU|nr:class I SAM-dependent methyltransferase [Actinomycetospora corticicola]NYD34552.1 hypothetical protein [Actinomycetospora corticicola]